MILAYYDGWKRGFKLPPCFSPLWSCSTSMKPLSQLLWDLGSWFRYCLRFEMLISRSQLKNDTLLSCQFWPALLRLWTNNHITSVYRINKPFCGFLEKQFVVDRNSWKSLKLIILCVSPEGLTALRLDSSDIIPKTNSVFPRNLSTGSFLWTCHLDLKWWQFI